MRCACLLQCLHCTCNVTQHSCVGMFAIPVLSLSSCTAFRPRSSATITAELICDVVNASAEAKLTIPGSNNCGQALLCQDLSDAISNALVCCKHTQAARRSRPCGCGQNCKPDSPYPLSQLPPYLASTRVPQKFGMQQQTYC